MAKQKYTVRGAYNFDEAENSNQGTHTSWEPSMTQQSQLEDSDINTIVKRFGITGKLPDNIRLPEYGDYFDVLDFHTAHNVIAAATSEFNKLPAQIRKEFDNDPSKFHDACINPDNLPRLRELGLAKPEPQKETPAAGPAPNGAPGQPAGDPKTATPAGVAKTS